MEEPSWSLPPLYQMLFSDQLHKTQISTNFITVSVTLNATALGAFLYFWISKIFFSGPDQLVKLFLLPSSLCT